MILEPKYTFKYYPSYGGYRLCKLDPIKGNIIGYVSNYGQYAKILKEHPELKKHYDSGITSDRNKLKNAITTLHNHGYSYDVMLDQAMKLGILKGDVEKLISQKHKLIALSKSKPSGIIDLSNIPISPPRFDEHPEEAYLTPDYLSLEERRKRQRKIRVRRKTKRCKCKK